MTTALDDDATTTDTDHASSDDIEVSKAPIVVSWADDEGHTQALRHRPETQDHVTFDLHFNSEAQTAFFKVTVNLLLKTKRNRSNVFLFIPPERVRSLHIAEPDDGKMPASRILGTITHTLRFNLAEPAALVVPKDDFEPKGEAARVTLESLQALARTMSFQIDLPINALSAERLVAICEKASCSGFLKSMLGVANMGKLYGGKGGRAMEMGLAERTDARSIGGSSSKSAANVKRPKSPLEDLQCPKVSLFGEATVDSPPSYPDGVPLYPTHQSNKRRRLDVSPEDASLPLLKLEDLIRHGFHEIGLHLGRIEQQMGKLGTRMDRIEQQICLTNTWSQSSSKQTEGLTEGLDHRVGCAEQRLAGLEEKLEACMSELSDKYDAEIAEIRYDFDTTTLMRIEDEMGVAQTQLEEFVRDEIRNVAEDVDDAVREKLRDALST